MLIMTLLLCDSPSSSKAIFSVAAGDLALPRGRGLSMAGRCGQDDRDGMT